MAPPGTKVLAHLKPGQRPTWVLHGEQGWITGPAPDHYRCLTCYFPIKKLERQMDTVILYPTVIPFPKVKIEKLRQTAADIITVLTDPPSTTTPSLQAVDPVRNGLHQL